MFAAPFINVPLYKKSAVRYNSTINSYNPIPQDLAKYRSPKTEGKARGLWDL